MSNFDLGPLNALQMLMSTVFLGKFKAFEPWRHSGFQERHRIIDSKYEVLKNRKVDAVSWKFRTISGAQRQFGQRIFPRKALCGALLPRRIAVILEAERDALNP